MRILVHSFGFIIVNKLYNPFFFLWRNQTISSSWLLTKAWKTSRRQFAIACNWIVDFNSLSRPFCLVKLLSLPFLVKFKFLFLQLQGLFHSVCVVILSRQFRHWKLSFVVLDAIWRGEVVSCRRFTLSCVGRSSQFTPGRASYIETPCLCTNRGHQCGGGKSTKTSGFHFCDKNVFIVS